MVARDRADARLHRRLLADHPADFGRRRPRRSRCPRARGRIDDAMPRPPTHCEVQASEFAPPRRCRRAARDGLPRAPAARRSEAPGSSQIFNNHIPLDPDLSGVVGITKTTPLINVARGQLVPYAITRQQHVRRDRSPTCGSWTASRPASTTSRARRASTAWPPSRRTVGRELIWTLLTSPASGRHTLQLLLAVGAGVSEGEFVNRAQAISSADGQRAVRRSVRDGTRRARSDLRLHRRDRQGLRRRQPQWRAGRGRGGPGRRSAGDGARPHRDHGRSTVASTSRARSRRAKAAAATSCSSSTTARCRAAIGRRPRRCRCSARRAARRCASTSARRSIAWSAWISPMRCSSRARTEMRAQWKPRLRAAACGAAEGARRSAPVLCRRSGGSGARRAASRSRQAADRGRLDEARLLLPARRSNRTCSGDSAVRRRAAVRSASR